jgi:hypothetical protein
MRARVAAADFHFLAVEELVSFYEWTPSTHRAFARCAARWCWRNSSDTRAAHRPTPAPWRSMASALATLDDDPGLRPDAHAFIFDRAPWFTVTDNLPQYPARIAGQNTSHNS